jgi:hypothetical protein
MMPSAITMISQPTTKPKIGFSIDSIVGNRLNAENIHEDSNDASHENSPKLPSDDLRREYSHLMKRPRQSPSPQNIDGDNKPLSRLSESSDLDAENNNRALKSSPTRSPSPIPNKGPIMVPGMHMNRQPMISHSHHHQLPPYHHELPPGHPHFLQFQAASALMHAQAAQNGFNGSLPQHLPHLHNPNMHRDSYPLYPWLLSRHGRIFPHRFPGSK